MADKTNIRPLFDNVLLEPTEGEAKTASGIIIPDTAKDKPQIGVIRAVGAGHRTPDGKVLPMSVKVGQKVMYKKWGGNEVKVESKDWLLVEEKDILAVVE